MTPVEEGYPHRPVERTKVELTFHLRVVVAVVNVLILLAGATLLVVVGDGVGAASFWVSVGVVAAAQVAVGLVAGHLQQRQRI